MNITLQWMLRKRDKDKDEIKQKAGSESREHIIPTFPIYISDERVDQ